MSLFRDIKPHNVMLDIGAEAADDVPVLLDFGSMGVARVDVTNISEARTLQVQPYPLNVNAQHCVMHLVVVLFISN